jgi:hypothetical protein
VCDAYGASASPAVGNGRSIDARGSGWEEANALGEKGRRPQTYLRCKCLPGLGHPQRERDRRVSPTRRAKYSRPSRWKSQADTDSYGGRSRSRSGLAAVNASLREAAISIVSPVAGLRP